MAVARTSDGKYEVQAWYKDHAGRRHKKHKRGFRTKAEARQWEREFALRASGSPSMTFRDFVDAYETDRMPQLKLNTWLTKRSVIDDKIVPFFGDMKLSEITPSDVIAWQNELSRAVSPRTGRPFAQTYLRTINNQLSALFNHACKYYGLRENPMRRVDRPGKAHAGEMLFWTKDEYLRFADAIMDKPVSFAAFEVLFWTGVREGELLALTPADFDFQKRLLRITKSYQRLRGEDVVTSPKTPRSVRTIAVPDFLADEVEEHVRLFGLGDDERIFKVSKHYLYREMQRGSKAAGIKTIRVHDLRHSHVSLLVDLGFSALAIADRMGHEAVDITYRYAHLFPSVQNDMAEALEESRRDGRTR